MIPIVYAHQQMNMQHAAERETYPLQFKIPEDIQQSYPSFQLISEELTLYTGTMLMISDFLKGDAVSML